MKTKIDEAIAKGLPQQYFKADKEGNPLWDKPVRIRIQKAIEFFEKNKMEYKFFNVYFIAGRLHVNSWLCLMQAYKSQLVEDYDEFLFNESGERISEKNKNLNDVQSEMNTI